MQFASKLERFLCRTRLFLSRTNGPNLSVRFVGIERLPVRAATLVSHVMQPSHEMSVKSTYKGEDREQFLIFLLRQGRFSAHVTLRKEDDRSRSNKADGFGKRDIFFIQLISLPPLTNIKSLSASSLHDDELRAQYLWTFSKSNA